MNEELVTTTLDTKMMHTLTAPEIRAQVNRIQEIMEAVMKKDIHYGVIPGCKKPSLYKAGAEKIALTFRIAVSSVVEDLSAPDEIKYRVTCEARCDNRFLGSAVGICSSSEEKYKWRKPVCDEEFDETQEDRKRVKWAHGRGGDVYQQKQIRTSPADVENTILQMADKRAYVADIRKVTAASDVFAMDIEDLPPEMIQNDGCQKPDIKKPQPKDKANDDKPKAVNLISEKQRKYLFVQADKANVSDDILHIYLRELGIEHTKDIPKSSFDKLLAWVEAGGQDIPS